MILRVIAFLCLGLVALQPIAMAQSQPVSAYDAADAAYRAYARGDYAAALRHARQAVALAPDNVDYRSLLATTLAGMRTARHQQAYRAADRAYRSAARGDHARALADARQAVALAPDNASYHALLASSLANSGQLLEADQTATDALRQFPSDAGLLAQRGFIRQRLGRPAEAMDDFTAALQAGLSAPEQHRNVVLALADAALSSQQPARAVDALTPIGDENSYAVASRLGFALAAVDRKAEALAVFSRAAQVATRPDERATAIRAEINLLVDLGRREEARARLTLAESDGSLAAASDLDVAYLAVRLGYDTSATRRFNAARQSGTLVGSAILDAAYANKRAVRNPEAIELFQSAIDANAAGQLPLAPQALFNARREVASLERSWGAYATLTYGAVGVMPGTLLAPPPPGNMLQAGSEIYWRPPLIGNRNGSIVEVFARAFETLSDGTGGPTGAPTLQGAAGLRWKPFGVVNLVLEGARLFPIGNVARNDWLARVAFSEGHGTDLRVEEPSWTMWQIYAEYDRYFVFTETVASFELRIGRSFRVDAIDTRLVATPFLALGGGYDDRLATTGALGAGPGIGFRWWFRQDRYTAPMSYVDLNVQYRFKLAGDNRARGVFVGLTVAF